MTIKNVTQDCECFFFSLQVLVRRFGKVDPSGIGDTVGAGAEIYKVEVLLKNLLLAQLAFQLEGQCRFLELARDRPVLT